MVKQAILSDIPAAELARLSALFGYGDGTPAGIASAQLFGGYSGVTFRIEEAAGARRLAVLKVCRGYPEAEVRAQAAIQGLLGARGFTGGCSALPLASAPGCYTALSSRGEPTCMLTHVEGSPADAAIEAGVDAVQTLRAVGEQLARLHLVRADAAADGLRTFRQGGACLLAEHAAGAILREMEGSEFVRAHPFVGRYRILLAELREAVRSADALPTGVLHGDPFLDNVLLVADPPLAEPAAPPAPGFGGAARTPVGSVSGAVAGLAQPGAGGPISTLKSRVASVRFVDFEDATVGPLVFDVACCAAGSCFVPPAARPAAGAQEDGDDDALRGGVLDAGRLAALLLGYCAVRPLSAAEKAHFCGWLRVCLACNASWRFVTFQVRNRDAGSGTRESYRELEARLSQIEAPDTLAMVHALLNALPQAPEDAAAARAPGGGCGGAARAPAGDGGGSSRPASCSARSCALARGARGGADSARRWQRPRDADSRSARRTGGTCAAYLVGVVLYTKAAAARSPGSVVGV